MSRVNSHPLGCFALASSARGKAIALLLLCRVYKQKLAPHILGFAQCCYGNEILSTGRALLVLFMGSQVKAPLTRDARVWVGSGESLELHLIFRGWSLWPCSPPRSLFSPGSTSKSPVVSQSGFGNPTPPRPPPGAQGGPAEPSFAWELHSKHRTKVLWQTSAGLIKGH